MANEIKYTMAEVSRATGIIKNRIYYRAKSLGIKFPCTYDQVKQIVGYKNKKSTPNKAAVQQLKIKLINDGFKVGTEE